MKLQLLAGWGLLIRFFKPGFSKPAFSNPILSNLVKSHKQADLDETDRPG